MASQSDESSGPDMMALMEHAQSLEEENIKLKKEAAKRNEILNQSRKFIEEYLDKSISSNTAISE